MEKLVRSIFLNYQRCLFCTLLVSLLLIPHVTCDFVSRSSAERISSQQVLKKKKKFSTNWNSSFEKKNSKSDIPKVIGGLTIHLISMSAVPGMVFLLLVVIEK